MTDRKTNAASDRIRRIEGVHNSLVKTLRSAFASDELTGDGLCAIEGVRIVEEALRSNLKFRAVFFRQSEKTRAERLVSQFPPHTELLLLPEKIFASAVRTENPQGVAALVHLRSFSLEDILARIDAGPVVVVAGLQDPGNLGTIIRSAEAFGAAGVLLAENTVSPFNAKVIRASAGSVFRLRLARIQLQQALEAFRREAIRMVATSSHHGTSLDSFDFSVPAAFFIGREGSGLSPQLMSRMDACISIPHSPVVESLNAAVSASLILYEASKQKAQ